MIFKADTFDSLISWLQDGDDSLRIFPGKGYALGSAFVRIPVGETVDAVYGENFCPGGKEKPFIDSSESLSQIGFFHRASGVFYFVGRPYDVPACESIASVMRALEEAVRAKAVERIQRDAESLKASASQETRERVARNDDLIHRLAYARFFGDEGKGSIDFPDLVVTRADAVGYLDAPEETLDRLVGEYLTEAHGDDFAFVLLVEDAVEETYAKLIAAPPQWAVAHRDIERAARESGAVNVRLTLENEAGQTMEVSYPASSIVGVPYDRGVSTYTGWSLTYRQMKEIEGFFRNDENRPYCGSGFRPEEVKQITYKKKVIYQRR